MSLQAFISRVVPWPAIGSNAVVNLHWRAITRNGKSVWGGRPHTTVETFVNQAAWAVSAASIKDLYFCLSLQGEMGRERNGKFTVARSAAQALALKAIWLDIDVKEPPKGYPTIENAREALDKFVAAAKLPPYTALVKSGGGLHVYWISDKSLATADWHPYAEGLRTLAGNNGLLCDAGITTDAARILRIPDTFNYKTDPPRPVELIYLADTDLDFAALDHIKVAVPVTAAVTHAAPAALPAAFAAGPAAAFAHLDPINDNLADGLGFEDEPIDPTAVFAKDGCPFFRDMIRTHGKDTGYPLWHLAMLSTTFMDNGRNIAHALSRDYLSYSQAATDEFFDKKLADRQQKKLGWPGCASFERDGCTLCANCIHKGKIKTPLHLAIAQPAPQAPPAAITTVAPDDLHLPDGYALDEFGCIGEAITDIKGTVLEVIPLFMCQLSSPWAQASPSGLHFITTTSKGRSEPVFIKQEEMATQADLIRALYKQQVKTVPKYDVRLRGFFMSWLTKLHALKAALDAAPFGWYFEEGARRGFTYGGKIMIDDNTERQCGFADANLRSYYTPKGNIAPWFDCLNLITKQRRPALEIIVATSFASPLMFVGGQYGATIWGYGVTSANKSTAMKVALSVWGHPKLAKESLGSTSKQLIEKMGQIKHLPMYWDDLQDKEQLVQYDKLLFNHSEGVTGGRLHSDLRFRMKGEWQNIAIVTSNHSFVDHLVANNRSGAQSLYRVFEFEISPAPEQGHGRIQTLDADRMLGALEQNFGLMGMVYSEFLARNHKAVDAYTKKIIEDFSKDVKQLNEERYWPVLCGCILAGAKFANDMGATFDLKAMREFLIEAYMKNRKRVTDEAADTRSTKYAEAALHGFLSSQFGATIRIDVIRATRGRSAAVTVHSGPDPRFVKDGIKVVWSIGDHKLRLSGQTFKDYLKANNYPITPVFAGMEKVFKMTREYVRIAPGTNYQCTQESVLEIPVPKGSELELVMYAGVPPDLVPDAVKERMAAEAEKIALSHPDAPTVVLPDSETLTTAVAQAQKDLALVRGQT